jgi:hypothetical protein
MVDTMVVTQENYVVEFEQEPKLLFHHTRFMTMYLPLKDEFII